MMKLKFKNFSNAGTVFFLLSLAACGSLSQSELSRSEANAEGSATSLGAASSFAVLGASTVTCAVAADVTGNLGVSPGTSITGFNPDCTITGDIHAGSDLAAQAHADLGIAYGKIKGVVCEHDLTGQDLGGQTLSPGIYCVDAAVGLTGDLTLDGGGDANAVWIFQVGSAITTATDSSVVMSGNGNAGNVFWQVGSSATIASGTAMKGPAGRTPQPMSPLSR